MRAYVSKRWKRIHLIKQVARRKEQTLNNNNNNKKWSEARRLAAYLTYVENANSYVLRIDVLSLSTYMYDIKYIGVVRPIERCSFSRFCIQCPSSAVVCAC